MRPDTLLLRPRVSAEGHARQSHLDEVLRLVRDPSMQRSTMSTRCERGAPGTSRAAILFVVFQPLVPVGTHTVVLLVGIGVARGLVDTRTS